MNRNDRQERQGAPGDAGNVDRRTILAAVAASGASALLPAPAGAAASHARVSSLPTPAALKIWTEKMVHFGERYAGSEAHGKYVDYLAEQLTRLGLAVKRDSEPLEHWQAKSWALFVGTGAARREVPVAAYYTSSGATSPEGVTGDLVWLEDANPGDKDLRGKIVAFHRKVPAGEWAFGKHVLQNIAPTQPGIRMDRQSVVHLILSPQLTALRKAGAAAVIIVEDDVPALTLEGAYAPFIYPYQDIPGLFVSARVGEELKRHADQTVTLRLEATRSKTTSDHISAIIPGESDEVVIVASHTDGPNAFEENGSLGVLALAHHLVKLPRQQRPRTIVLVGVTGHMAQFAGKDLGGWFAKNADLKDRAVAVLAIEHLGASEWISDGDKARASGAPEQGMCFVSPHPVLEALVKTSFRQANLRNSAVLGPADNVIPGIANAPYRMGIPTIGYLTSPDYLISWAHNDHIDKFDAHRMHDELRVFADMIHHLGRANAAELRSPSG